MSKSKVDVTLLLSLFRVILLMCLVIGAISLVVNMEELGGCDNLLMFSIGLGIAIPSILVVL